VTTLQRWSIIADPYRAPECQQHYLQGRVYGHPEREDGERISTSCIIGAEGRVIECRSRKYKLGRIHPDYRQWLRENEIEYDPKQPVKVR
jgi:hypothetical protein